MSGRIISGFALAAALLAAGCAARKYQISSADFGERAGSLKRLGVLVAEARIYNLHGEGEAALVPEASERFAAAAETAAKQVLGERGYVAAAVSRDDDGLALLADYLRIREELYTAFSSSRETIEGIARLAGAAAVCARSGVDGIVFVGVRDQVPAGGRKVIFGSRALFHLYYGGKGVAAADLAVIDRNGKLVFYAQKSGKQYDLTEDEDLGKLLGELAAGLPQAGAKVQ